MASKSNFNTATRQAAYWGYTDPDSGAKIIQRTQGYSFVRKLQQSLQSAFKNSGGIVPTYSYIDANGKKVATVDSGKLSVDGAWGPTTNRLMAAYAMRQMKSLGYMQDDIDAQMAKFASEEEAKQIGIGALSAAIYMAYYPKSDNDLITVFDGTIPPPWNKTPPADASAYRGITVDVPVNVSFGDTASSMQEYGSASKPNTTPAKPPVTPPATTPIVVQAPPSNTAKYIAFGALGIAIVGTGYYLYTK